MNATLRYYLGALLLALCAAAGGCVEIEDGVPSASQDCPGTDADGRACDDADPCTAYDTCSAGL